MQRRTGIDGERGVVVVGAFAQHRRPPSLVGRPSAVIVSLAAYRAARALRKGHVWLQLSQAGSECD